MDTNKDPKEIFANRVKQLGIKVGNENNYSPLTRFVRVEVPLTNYARRVFQVSARRQLTARIKTLLTQNIGSYVILGSTRYTTDVYFPDVRHASLAFSHFRTDSSTYLAVDDTVVSALKSVGVNVHEGPVVCQPSEYNWYSLVGEISKVSSQHTGELLLEYFVATRAFEATRIDTAVIKQSSRKDCHQDKNVVTMATVPRKNTIDLARVANGLDTRTTLMIRNIPNKFTQMMLQEWVDKTSQGTYDFLYLRMDFRNRCK